MDSQGSLQPGSVTAVSNQDGFGLPGWIYRDAEFLQAERQRVFAPSWQLICHVSDIPNPGDYQTLDFLGEPLVALRGQDGAIKAFYNVCRHRAARLLDGGSGHCAGRIVCPYHAWTYALDGRLTTLPHRKEFDHFSAGSLRTEAGRNGDLSRVSCSCACSRDCRASPRCWPLRE